MKKDPLPAEFVIYVKRLALHAQCRGPRHVWRFLLIRWGFWQDGTEDNSLPGYTTCPKPAIGSGFPAGWSYRKIHDIAKEAIGTAAIHAARQAATHIDCGSGYSYGICPVCGKGHGHVLYQDGQPSTLVTAAG